MKHKTSVVIGMDAGGTKTECAAVDLNSGASARVVGDASNYQGIGIRRAQEVWADLVARVRQSLGTGSGPIAAAGLGIAGLDRPEDEARIAAAFDAVLPGVPRILENDAYLVLRAGTDDGVGVTAISGSGANAMGQARDGRKFRVNGLGPDFGDFGSAHDIGSEAVRRAFRSLDGRNPPTSLVAAIERHAGVGRLTDLVDFFLFDRDGFSDFHPGLLAPLVFQEAGEGDSTAIAILDWAGCELGCSALAVARQLFGPQDHFPLVLGGSVLQKGTTGHLKEALLRTVRLEFPNVEPRVLASRPVLGALRYGVDRALAQGIASDLELWQGAVSIVDRVVAEFCDIDTTSGHAISLED